LQRYGLLGQLLATAIQKSDGNQPNETQEQVRVAQSLAKLRKSGDLPLKVFGDLEQKSLEETLQPCWVHGMSNRPGSPTAPTANPSGCKKVAVVLEDWIDHLRGGDVQPESVAKRHSAAPLPGWNCNPASLLVKARKDYSARPEKLLGAWVRTLAIAASGAKARGILVGRDGVVEIPPYPQEKAVQTLKGLLQLWSEGMNSPLPLPLKTALAFAAEKDAVHVIRGRVHE
jgi:exodeoxyribonuclease V gamma subunit